MQRQNLPFKHACFSLGLSLALICQAGCGDDPGDEAGNESADTETGDGDGDGTEVGDGDGEPGDGDGEPGDGDGEPGCQSDAECADLDTECSVGVCDLESGACGVEAANEGNACGEDNLCITGATCNAGECGGGDELDCSALDDQCSVGVCNPGSGECEAEAANEGGACNDGNSCTYGDVCDAGACAGSSDPLFADDFSADSGWVAEGKWEIGVAVASQPGTISGLADPADDHSESDDGMLAGVVIGGLSGPPGHEPQYLTSPIIDLSVLDPEATVSFNYWRVLITGMAFMAETIDVWDGEEWVNVYLAAGLAQDEWVEASLDISAYKNADFQVRFGHEYTSLSPVGPAEPSWSVDDVSIVPVCP